MQPSHTRLVCRAHNRFTPSIVLWQHFIAPLPHFHLQQRLSSTAPEPTNHGADGLSESPNPQDMGEADRVGTEIVSENNLDVDGKPAYPLRIRRMKVDRGTWHSSPVEASVLKNNQRLREARLASLTGPEKLLAQARAAFDDAADYKGVVVKPMTSPNPVSESHLPWSVSSEERPSTGIDRLEMEIQKFYQFTTPDHSESLARRHVIEQLREHVRQTLPKHVLEVFGSQRTGLALATSDIDLRLMKREQLEEPASARSMPTPSQRAKAMKSLHTLHWNTLAKHKAYLLPTFRYARYPLVSLQDRQSGLDAQIVLSNDTSVSRQLMQDYMEQYPYLRQVYYVVKTIFDVRGLSDVFRGGFGSYTLFMMIVGSIRHKPHPRNDAAGALINFLKFYRDFDTEHEGISIEPVSLFDKREHPVMTDTTRAKLEQGTAKPLPTYMLCLRDPADETNDLGRRAIAIKHVRTTFKQLVYNLEKDMAVNTRASILGPLVGTSYMLNKARRDKLRRYGHKLSYQLNQSLAAKAKKIRDDEAEEVLGESEEENGIPENLVSEESVRPVEVLLEEKK